MKNIALGICVLTLSGCSWLCPKPDTVKVPVWTPPKIEMPVKPELRSINNSKVNQDQASKAVQTDMNNLSLYATQLENILNEVKTYNPTSIKPVEVK